MAGDGYDVDRGRGGSGFLRYPAMTGKVLVVDDDPIARSTITHVLTTAGFDVVVCESLDRAIRTLSLWLFDLIVCDQSVSGRNGMDLADEAAACPTPFVLLVDVADRRDRPGVDTSNVSAVVPQPVSATELLAVAALLVPTPVNDAMRPTR